MGVASRTLVIAALVVFVTAATAAACVDAYTVDWNCSGDPYQTCWSPASNHSYGHVHAINTASDYRKCAKIQNQNSGYVYTRKCYPAYTVTASCSGNDGACGGDPNCTVTALLVAVGNDTSVDHGLRGQAHY